MKPSIDFEKIVEAAQLYRPDVLSPYAIMGELVEALTSQIAIAESAERILDNWRRNIYRKKKSNNWLRMHKIPMRRRGL